ncbi:redoxin domain-containing protein [Paenibacillus puerhi]|uniref:redoxin domain-containing protein n=1 Tax=Paenibacillus puerhi TaxID=2692622 RepID=UPI0013590CAB|nr:redoxin domain-containing protein [Paenibacillus puerhi]
MSRGARIRPRTALNAAILILLAAALLYTLLQIRTDKQGILRVGDAAPEFTAMTLEGEAVALSDYRGQGVMLNFWASWCGPCVSEMPRMNEAYEDDLPGVAVLAVNVGESRGTAAGFVSDHKLTFPILLDPSGEAADSYGLIGLPRTFLIDKQGRIAQIVPGELASVDQIRELMESVRP